MRKDKEMQVAQQMKILERLENLYGDEGDI
jgi:hypothetical protein